MRRGSRANPDLEQRLWAADDDSYDSLEEIPEDDGGEETDGIKGKIMVNGKGKKFRNQKRCFEDGRITAQVTHSLLVMERGMMAFSLCCISLSLIVKEIEIGRMIEGKEEDSPMVYYIDMVNLGISLLMVFTNIFTKYMEFTLLKLRYRVKQSARFLHERTLFTLLIQTVMILMCPYPFLAGRKSCSMNGVIHKQVCYRYNDFLHLMQFLKLSYIVKSYAQTGKYASAAADRVCQYFSVKNSAGFLIRCFMKDRPMRNIAAIFVFGILFFGYALRIAEAPLITVDQGMNMTSLANCCWNALITMTTVGYGDFYPRTIMGRGIVLFCCIWGMVNTSLMVTVMTNQLILNSSETKAYTVINRLMVIKQMKTKAAGVVNLLGSLFIGIRDKRFNEKGKASRILVIQERNKDIRALEQDYKAMRTYDAEEEMEANFSIVKKEMKELKEIAAKMRADMLAIAKSSSPAKTSPTRGN